MNEIELQWDLGTGYDFFISLEVLHEPAKYGLRASWAAGVRSRIPTFEREILERLINVSWPLHWVYRLPKPKDSLTLITGIEALSPDERLPALVFDGLYSRELRGFLLEVAERGTWSKKDVDAILALEEGKKKGKKKKEQRKKVSDLLDVWANAAEFEEGLVASIKAYRENFFAEEERRILPALETALAEAQDLAAELSFDELMLTLSQGVLLSEWKSYKRTVMVPSFWSMPYMLFVPLDKDTEIRAFGARPADASLVPGEAVPDALYQALKALADPTRLKILHYLSDEALSPAELARRLRLRPPTVTHHLSALRLARLVQVNVSYEGRFYAARPEAIEDACMMLERFVNKGDSA